MGHTQFRCMYCSGVWVLERLSEPLPRRRAPTNLPPMSDVSLECTRPHAMGRRTGSPNIDLDHTAIRMPPSETSKARAASGSSFQRLLLHWPPPPLCPQVGTPPHQNDPLGMKMAALACSPIACSANRSAHAIRMRSVVAGESSGK